MEDRIIICRCQELTEEDIIEAIKDGARTIDGIKRRTRAGMGLCQGKTCERLVANILAKHTNQNVEDLIPPTRRMPVRPINIGIIGDEDIIVVKKVYDDREDEVLNDSNGGESCGESL